MKRSITLASVSLAVGALLLAVDAGPVYMYALVAVTALGHVYQTRLERRDLGHA